mmetsp:Transcript_20384/g.28813  ORF Transcript_20384/g.28813 Transcript_20384/m.28813 type:complete len:245 (-) Transcript_20384:919-1653(-)
MAQRFLLLVLLLLSKSSITIGHQHSITTKDSYNFSKMQTLQSARGGSEQRIINQDSMQLQRAYKSFEDRENAFTVDQKAAKFDGVIFIAFLNILLNTMRPDEDISWQMRFPRFCWELSIALVASCTNQKRPAPAVYLLLSMMTGSTAIVDTFIWAPIFAYTASFETCTGGGFFSRQPKVCYPDYAKGIGRLVVSGQSLFTGLYYLMTAIMSWGAYTAVRDQHKVERHVQAVRLASQHSTSLGTD